MYVKSKFKFEDRQLSLAFRNLEIASHMDSRDGPLRFSIVDPWRSTFNHLHDGSEPLPFLIQMIP